MSFGLYKRASHIEINENPVVRWGYSATTSVVSSSVGANVGRNGRGNFAACYLSPSIGNLIISVYVPNEFLIFIGMTLKSLPTTCYGRSSMVVFGELVNRVTPVRYDLNWLWTGTVKRNTIVYEKDTTTIFVISFLNNLKMLVYAVRPIRCEMTPCYRVGNFVLIVSFDRAS